MNANMGKNIKLGFFSTASMTTAPVIPVCSTKISIATIAVKANKARTTGFTEIKVFFISSLQINFFINVVSQKLYIAVVFYAFL